MSKIINSLTKLEKYIEDSNYKGYDPYDALKSKLFNLPVLRSSKLIRFGSQQFLKRFPINLRKVIGVPKGENPVTLGLCIQGYSYLYANNPTKETEYLDKINNLIARLEKLIPSGFSGACWGYDFDWEARRANIPAYQPTVVATGIISNSLFECWKITGISKCAELVVSSSHFVINDLKKTYEGDTFCYSYSPFDSQCVLNASMKGVRILSQTYSITKDESLFKEANAAVEYVINKQQKNGAFNYSDHGKWVDNYHTGYVLDSLHEFIENFKVTNYTSNLELGIKFYEENFITSEGIPKFYSGKTHPIDCTAAAQTILTMSRFEKINLAENVANWMCSNMQSANGSFYFRIFKNYKIKTSFMRWSNAWMFASLSYLMYKQNNKIS